jgi:hypothetical protein
MYDEDEELFAEIVDTYAEMQYKCAEAVLSLGLPFDYAHYWEDICFKSGPLLSPSLFDELCAKHYKKRNELCHKHGIDIISLDCDGVTEALIPTWIENGVNVLFPIEVGVWGDQFEAARKKHGERLLGVGGMDKTAFRKNKAAVDAEIERLKSELHGFGDLFHTLSEKAEKVMDEQQKIVRCKYCKHSEEWYGDKRRCFLWNENGIDVFEDGYCSYGKKENEE